MDQSADHQILVDDKVSSYIIAGNKIFYSFHSLGTQSEPRLNRVNLLTYVI